MNKFVLTILLLLSEGGLGGNALMNTAYSVSGSSGGFTKSELSFRDAVAMLSPSRNVLGRVRLDISAAM